MPIRRLRDASLVVLHIAALTIPSFALADGASPIPLSPCPIEVRVSGATISMRSHTGTEVHYDHTTRIITLREFRENGVERLTRSQPITEAGAAVMHTEMREVEGRLTEELTLEAFAAPAIGSMIAYFPFHGDRVVVVRSVNYPDVVGCAWVPLNTPTTPIERVSRLNRFTAPGVTEEIYAKLGRSMEEHEACKVDVTHEQDLVRRTKVALQNAVKAVADSEEALRKERRRKELLQKLHAVAYAGVDRLARAANRGAGAKESSKILKSVRRETKKLIQEYSADAS